MEAGRSVRALLPDAMHHSRRLGWRRPVAVGRARCGEICMVGKRLRCRPSGGSWVGEAYRRVDGGQWLVARVEGDDLGDELRNLAMAWH
jgi:hypothetical protein